MFSYANAPKGRDARGCKMCYNRVYPYAGQTRRSRFAAPASAAGSVNAAAEQEGHPCRKTICCR